VSEEVKALRYNPFCRTLGGRPLPGVPPPGAVSSEVLVVSPVFSSRLFSTALGFSQG
jgi:hypothetical protein